MSKENFSRARLDQFVLDIEFLLISVVQGVALAALASSAVGPFSNLEFEHWPYIMSGFLFILVFWSQAIIHAISFIDWPLDLPHNFLYFAASLIEVMAFSHVNDPVRWFAFIIVFFFIAALLYVVDLRLMLRHKTDFEGEKRKALYKHIVSRQLFELQVFIPMGLAFNVISFFLVVAFPGIFIGQKLHLALITLQVVFGIGTLVNSILSFKTRSKLITATLET